MNRFFTLLLAASCLTAVGQVTYPYNPDGNADGDTNAELQDLWKQQKQKVQTLVADVQTLQALAEEAESAAQQTISDHTDAMQEMQNEANQLTTIRSNALGDREVSLAAIANTTSAQVQTYNSLNEAFQRLQKENATLTNRLEVKRPDWQVQLVKPPTAY